jgi:hypothetical protein
MKIYSKLYLEILDENKFLSQGIYLILLLEIIWTLGKSCQNKLIKIIFLKQVQLMELEDLLTNNYL